LLRWRRKKLSVTDYPYEGDLSAVFEAVAVPRIVDEAVTAVWAQMQAVFPWLPSRLGVDEILKVG
jgi:hypothetical protein